jgi:hypothetical protein
MMVLMLMLVAMVVVMVVQQLQACASQRLPGLGSRRLTCSDRAPHHACITLSPAEVGGLGTGSV